MPWYARLVLGKSITWHDVFEVDPEAKVKEGGWRYLTLFNYC